MAGEQFLLLEVGADRDGEVSMGGHLTLGSLLDRCRTAEANGVSRDTPIEFGYLPNDLVDGIFVTKSVDLTTLSLDVLKGMAISRNERDSGPAWSEIERRLAEGGA